MLRLVGLEKTRITRKSRHDGTSSRHANVQKNKFLSHEMQLASFAGKATTGSHRFPFSLALPPGLPPSTEVQYEETAVLALVMAYSCL